MCDERSLNELTPEELEARIEMLIDEALGGEPRSEQWREWREALEERLRHLRQMRSKGIVEFENMDELIRDIEEKIKVLREEEIITEFVEQQVRALIGKLRLQKEIGEELELA
ncbi:MAG: hypothetical protein RMK18_00725 [Armatimonadota bacterium]|nr:hypothetical protein [Armatimonadota bacterium]MCX7777305.1 hypothetical protein [Armatimonadota bacterium]MDW8024378.1 hypothetical protein [Armatimonadota bacterium]